jgi:UMF1 family MFS transporter
MHIQRLWFKFSPAERGWLFYDWANSSFSLIVVTAVLPSWLATVGQNSGISTASTTAWWSYANSASTLIVAILAPLLGTLADFQGWKKVMWGIATSLGVIGTLLLAAVPENGFWELLALFMLANIGYSIANLYYDAFLTDVTTTARMSQISSWGFGIGYIGGVLPFVIFYLVRGLMSGEAGVLFAFILAGLWWGIFSLPMLFNVRQKHYLVVPVQPIRAAWQRLRTTLRHLAAYPKIVGFLVAYFFYIDGVNTIITEAALFATAVGIQTTTLLTILLAVQLIAFPASIIFGRLANSFGERRMILVGIGIYAFIAVLSLFIRAAWGFWLMAVLIGLAQGGIQALSRSYFGRLIPKERASEFFGFYNIFGRFSAVLGPVVFGTVSALTGQVQFGAASLLIFFVLGGWIFSKYA